MQKTGRRRRVRWLKYCNMCMTGITIVMLIALCGALLVRVQDQKGTIEVLSGQVEELSLLASRQQVQLGHLAEELQTVRKEAGESRDSKEPDTGQEETKDDKKTPDDKKIQDNKESGREDKEDAKETAAQAAAAHKVYLTFDDGPSNHTQDILDILDEYGVKATFFVVGDNAANKDILNRIVEGGHTLGMHSCSHKYGELYASVENFAEDFVRQRDFLYETVGVNCTLYRFPGGSSNTVKSRTIEMAEFARYLDEQKTRFFDWNISSGDGGSVVLPVETLLENCTANVGRYSTAVILMHDTAIKTTTVEAMPAIIETIQSMEDTVILPITDETPLIQHIKWQDNVQTSGRTLP